MHGCCLLLLLPLLLPRAPARLCRYVMDHSRQHAAHLRQVIAGVVASDPVTYNEGFLGKENDEYCK